MARRDDGPVEKSSGLKRPGELPATQQGTQRKEEQAFDAKSQQLLRPNTPQDTYSARAKNSGHGKKTADKWNQ